MGIRPVRHDRTAVSGAVEHGFTLLEVLLSLALMSAIVGVSAPIYQSFQVKNDLDLAANAVAAGFRRAQILSLASDGDSSWGVHIAAGSITIFKGASYAGRDSAYDETTVVPGTITPTGLGDAVFARVTGASGAAGTVTLTASTGQVRTVALSAKGTVTY